MKKEALSDARFDQIVRNQSHKLYGLLPPRDGFTAPVASDISNYWFVRQISLKHFYYGEQF